MPDALATVVAGVTAATGKTTATIVGFFLDATFSVHGFLCTLPVSQTCFTRLDVILNGVPQARTQATRINQQQLLGSFRDQALRRLSRRYS